MGGQVLAAVLELVYTGTCRLSQEVTMHGVQGALLALKMDRVLNSLQVRLIMNYCFIVQMAEALPSVKELLKRDQLLVFPVGRKTVVEEKSEAGISVMFKVTEVGKEPEKNHAVVEKSIEGEEESIRRDEEPGPEVPVEKAAAMDIFIDRIIHNSKPFCKAVHHPKWKVPRPSGPPGLHPPAVEERDTTSKGQNFGTTPSPAPPASTAVPVVMKKSTEGEEDILRRDDVPEPITPNKTTDAMDICIDQIIQNRITFYKAEHEAVLDMDNNSLEVKESEESGPEVNAATEEGKLIGDQGETGMKKLKKFKKLKKRPFHCLHCNYSTLDQVGFCLLMLYQENLDQ